MRTKKIFLTAISAVLAISMLAACGSDSGNAAGSDNADGTAAEAAEETAAAAAETDAPSDDGTKVSITTPAVPTEPFDLDGGVTDEMYSRALLNEGSVERLAAAMRKAENGESVTVGVIGGSITQGTAASNQALCYGSLFFKWWQEKFPACEINTVNAGIGGTNSYLGVNRVNEQLLAYSPDAVIVEFSVNDTDKVMNKYSYDSLVRTIMNSDSQPAVILLFTTQENGASLQDVHREIGTAYDLPMISYREAVYPEVAAGTLDWKAISPDNIHPNDAGHSLIGQLLSRYLDGVYDRIDEISADVPAFDYEPYTKDYYKDSEMYFPSTLETVMTDGFEAGTNSVYPDKFPDNWVTSGGGTLSFELDCRTLGLFYLKTTDGKGGKYEVYVDGERKGMIDSDFSGGWGNYGETKPIFIDTETAHHTVEIKPAEGSETAAMTILSVMAS